MISSCSRWMVATMSPIWPVRAWPRAASRAPGPPRTMSASSEDPSGRLPANRSRRRCRKYSSSTPVTAGPARPGGGAVAGPGGPAPWPGRTARPPEPASRPPGARGPRPRCQAADVERLAASVPGAGAPGRSDRSTAPGRRCRAGPGGPGWCARRCLARCGTGRCRPAPVSRTDSSMRFGSARIASSPSWARSRKRCSSSSVRCSATWRSSPPHADGNPPLYGAQGPVRATGGPGGPPRASRRVRHGPSGCDDGRACACLPARPRRRIAVSEGPAGQSTPTPSSSPPAGASRCRTPRSGSCARPGGRCPSTGPARGTGTSWTPSPTPSWPPRSPCSRSAATAWTPPSSSPTSSCRCTPSASGSTWSPGAARSSTEPLPRRRRPRPAAPARARRGPPYVPETVRRSPRARADGPAHRLRRGTVHRGQLPGRGRAVPGPSPRSRRSCTPSRRSGTTSWTGWPMMSRRLPAGPGRGRGAAALQLFDSWAGALSPRRLRAASSCRRPQVLAGRGRPRRARPSSSASAPASSWPHGGRRRRRGRRRLAGAPRRGPAAVGPGGPSRATSTRRSAWPRGRWSAAEAREVLAVPAPQPATSSTWATACCPRPTPASSPSWWTWSTPRGTRA